MARSVLLLNSKRTDSLLVYEPNSHYLGQFMLVGTHS